MIEDALRRFRGDKAKAARYIGGTGDEATKMQACPGKEGFWRVGEGWRKAG
jgi:hypothetical protein